MMHNAYSSSILSLKSFYAFNDYSYYSNQRCPSSCCSCCCSFPINFSRLIVPTNPSFLYGLRQSTLIQWTPSRRVILGPSIYDVGRCCCGESCRGKLERVDRFLGKSFKENNVNVDKIGGRMARPRRGYRSTALGDAEAMLSLLTEESVEECVVFRERKRSSSKEGKVVRKQNVDKKENVGCGYLESKLKKHQLEAGVIQSREEGCERREERKGLLKDEDRRLRRRESSSSYYSLSDIGDFESDIDVDIEHDGYVGESSTSHGKDSRKNGGVVINEETKMELERYISEKDEQLRSSTQDDLRVGSSNEWDWRKKSEKKLTDESAEETKSRKDFALRQFQVSQANESTSVMASSSKKRTNHRKEKLTSDVSYHGQSRSHIDIDNRVNEYSKSSGRHAQSTESDRHKVETTSTAWRRSSQGEGEMVVGSSAQETGCDYCKTCGRSMEQNQAQSRFQQHAELSESPSETRNGRQEKGSNLRQASVEVSGQGDQIYVTTGQVDGRKKSQRYGETVDVDERYLQSTSRSQQQSETRLKNLEEKSTTIAQSQSQSRHNKQEKSSSSLLTSIREESKQHDQLYVATGQADARRKSQHYSETMGTDASYVQSTLRSPQQLETRMKNSEEKSTSLISNQEVKRLQEESGGKAIKEIESSVVSGTGIGASQVHSTGMETKSHSASGKRIYDEQTYLTRKVKSVEESVEKHKQIDKTIMQSTIGAEVQGAILLTGVTGNISGEASITPPSAALISQTGAQQVSKGEVKSDLQLSVTSPLNQFVERSEYGEPSSSFVRNDSGRITEVGTGSACICPQSRTVSSPGDVNDSGRKSCEESSPEDALGSAERMQVSSTQVVGEFVEKVRHEVSTSETRSKENLSQRDPTYQDKKYMLKGSNESDVKKTGLQKQDSKRSSGGSGPDSEKTRLQKQDSKHSSGDFGTREPSDEMWDVKDHFVQEASETESLEGATSGSVVTGRMGKSLWNVVAGIFRLRWGSRSETQKSPVKGQSSQNESAGGETWFSENEADEANGDSIKTEQISVLQKPTSADQALLRRTTGRSPKENVRVMSSEHKLGHAEVGASSSSSVLQSDSQSGSVSTGEISYWNITQQTPLSIPSDFSTPSAKQLRRSHAIEEIEEAGTNEGCTSSTGEQGDQSNDVRRTSVSAAEKEDVEPKRMKLQRSKQVLQERFDEWEDAYRLEREQRKVDEIFMREALADAIKAADSWEVPVGAVLVQNGNIIARGYNLVEELRDSTAHAEMICIREASKALRTWRLSETTLYVTLEPCPMCAGAILQARIGTLVWGAPNKLLGADGSWIRLFPEDMEREPRSEVADKPAAPVHPFHPKMNIRRGVLEEECAEIMQQFFQLRRRKEKEKEKEKSEEPNQPHCLPKPHHPSKLLNKMHNLFHIMFCL